MSRVVWWNGGGLLYSISYGSSFFGLGIFGKAEKAFFSGRVSPEKRPRKSQGREFSRLPQAIQGNGGRRRRPTREATAEPPQDESGGSLASDLPFEPRGGVARLEKSARADCNIAPGGAISALKRRRHEVFLSRRPPLEGAPTKLLPPTLRAPPLSFEDAPTARHRNSGTKGALPPQGTRPCGLAAALRGRREAKQTSEVEQGGLAAALRFKAMWRGSFLYLT